MSANAGGRYAYPESFPTPTEERFLKLVLAGDEEFPARWEAWRAETAFDDMDHATFQLLPLLHLRLSKLGVRDELAGRIRGVYRLAWVKNQIILDATRRLAEKSAARGVDILLLKGMALLRTAYADTGARFLGDGDILVRSADALAVFETLLEDGWKSTDPSVPSAEAFRAFGIERVKHAASFAKDGVELEVHWHVFHQDGDLSPLRLLTLRDLPGATALDVHHWDHASVTTIKGVPVKTLSPEDTLIHVMAHGAQTDGGPRLFRWVADAVTVFRAVSIDYDRLCESARVARREADLLVACDYLSKRMGVGFPGAFVEKLEALSIPPADMRRYYRNAKARYPLLGNFPSLWYRYWKFESKGAFLVRLLKLPDYLARAWGLPGARALPGFVAQKYAERARRLLGRS